MLGQHLGDQGYLQMPGGRAVGRIVVKKYRVVEIGEAGVYKKKVIYSSRSQRTD